MSAADADEAETMQGAFQLGYTRQQVIKSIALALALHAAIVGAYLVLGSEKKPPQGKMAANEEKKDADGKDAASGAAKTPDAKTDASKSGETSPTTATNSEDAKTPAKAKGAEASKASELPTAPDSDIDAILKAK